MSQKQNYINQIKVQNSDPRNEKTPEISGKKKKKSYQRFKISKTWDSAPTPFLCSNPPTPLFQSLFVVIFLQRVFLTCVFSH